MLRIEPLGSNHDRAGFDCGVPALNRYLRETARQHVAKGIARTFVLVDDRVGTPKPVHGFFTLSLCQVLADEVPPKWAKKLPRQIPAMRLGRLAVARTHQREGFGKILLVEAIYKVASVASAAGGIGLFVDAKNPAAADFYTRFGFEPTPTEPLTLFMPMDTVRRLVQP
ncbi:MAG: GNAT family N-acetyltransferase [Candidatus Binatia bacterium]